MIINESDLRRDPEFAMGAFFDIPRQYTWACDFDATMTPEKFADKCAAITKARVLAIIGRRGVK